MRQLIAGPEAAGSNDAARASTGAPIPCPRGLESLEPRLLLSGSLLITEFMADNKTTIADVDGDFSDWIELQNTSDAAINLNGWKLADSSATWTFPSKTLQPGEIIVVFASDKNRTNPAQQMHTNFKLSASGELLRLIQPGGAVEQEFNPYPEQFEDVSYGISQDAFNLLSAGTPLKYRIPTAGDAALGTTWTLPGFNDSSFSSTVSVPSSTILITEVATGTDWLEIHNVSSGAVNTSGWVLAINDTATNINTVDPNIKALPSSLTSGQVQYYTESSNAPAANQWGSSIAWGTTSNGWVMILDAAGQVVDYVAWGFSALQISSLDVTVNGFRVTAANLPWSGAGVSSASATSTGSMKRTGTSDLNNSSNFAFNSTQTQGGANPGLVTPFPTGTTPATSGIGYSADGAASGFDVTYYKSNVAVTSLAAALGVISTPSQQTQVISGKYDTINFYNTTTTGLYAGDQAFPGTVIGTDADDFVIRATTAIYIPEPGNYTFGVRSDDGFGMDITGASNFHMEFAGVRGPTDSLATFNFTSAGIYDLTLTYFERTGGSELELFAAPGTFTAFSAADFDLVGDVTNGGIAIAGFAGDIRTDVESAMKGVNSSLWTRLNFNVTDPNAFDLLTLAMKYDAGFVAYLNGVEVARRNAPVTVGVSSAATTERSNEDASFFESINITSFINQLVVGNNTLAIHGLNSSAGDDDFLILPVLTASSTSGILRYFDGATPGATNSGGFLAFVKDTKFSHDRGFYDAPFALTITTNTVGASIRYTTDGSLPSATHGTLYTGPINITGSTVMRAIAYKAGFEPTNVDTQTYFFLSDILTQSASGAAPAGWPSSSVNGQQFNYGMDPDIVNDPVWGPQMIAALTSIPSFSVVTDMANLVDPATGIYVNPREDGELWERPISLELLDPLGLEEGFQIDAGLRLRGGFSRDPSNPKHSMRFFFRNEYGGDLFYDLFGDEGADRFDKMDLRTSQNYSWAFQNDGRNIMNRDVFFRDLQRDMGDPYTRSRYYHLYLNGQYWGLYQTQERSEANYAATYFGGDPDDYDVVKVEAGPYQINATDGNLDAWNALWTLAGQGFDTAAKYYRVLGRNADGTRNPAFPVYVDQVSLIDYMIEILWGGNLDAPISNFLGNNSPNNWYGIYNRTTADQGFKFFAHDSEHTLLTSNLNTNRNGPFPAGDTFDKSNPQWLHQQLMQNAEYRILFADRVQLHFFNDGVLTVENNIERFMARANEIQLAIIAESARWGDAQRAAPYTKTDWQNEINNLVNNYFPQRNNIVLNQLRNTVLRDGSPAPLLPSLDAPSYNVHGGQVGQNFDLVISAVGGLVYYTLDGTDPRLPGGAISPSALIYTPSSSTNTIVAAGSLWKYLDSGVSQGTAWRASGFNDSGWSSGNAQLGYGDGDEATTVGFGPNAATKYTTTYFRKTFDAGDTSNLAALTLLLKRDDGAVVYLNGQELVRSNMPNGEILFGTPAFANVGGVDETTFFEFNIDPAKLLSGQNTLAVEIHQIAGDSTDISFDMQLIAQLNATANAIRLTESGLVNARVFNGTTWSAINSASFQLNTAASALNLAVTEINYNPTAPTAAELAQLAGLAAQDFEFVELLNFSEETIDLFGVRFTAGIAFDFTNADVISLAPGEFVLVIVNQAAFDVRYGTGLSIAGIYTGALANGGEQLLLVDRDNATIADITYGNTGDWPSRANGQGSTLERIDNSSNPDNGKNWRSSSEVHGTPGTAGIGPDNRIVFNEVLSHTDLPLLDSLELYNTTGNLIDIGGWFLSDSAGNLSKYRIPNGTAIAPGGYLVFDEDDFNPGDGTLPNDFAFDAALGDSAYFVQADPVTGKLLRFVDVVSLGAQANGESWGRYPNAAGELTPMLVRSLGAANGEPRIGPVYFSEIMYNPPLPVGGLPAGVTADDLEYVEIFNSTAQPVLLTEWRIRGGIDYDFAAGSTLPAGATQVIVSFDPANPLNADKLAAFRSVYGLDQSVVLIGGYSGQLDNGGEEIRLERPDEPPTENPTLFPRLLEDRVRYGDAFPWATGPDGEGDALHRRRVAQAYGSFASSWYAGAPTPSSISNDLTAPVIMQVLVGSTHWAASYLNYLSTQAMGDGGYALLGGSSQLDSLTWTNLNLIKVRFNEAMILDVNHLTLIGVDHTQMAVASFEYDVNTFTATWTLGAMLTSDKWVVHLNANATDTSGNTLDGEWNNSGDVFPTGNGTQGGDMLLRFNLLTGDVNSSGDVTADDLALVKAAQFKDTADVGYLARYDVNGSGRILVDDVILVRNRQTMTLPAGEPVIESPVVISEEPVQAVEVSSPPVVPAFDLQQEQEDIDDPADTVPAPAPDGNLLAALYAFVKESGAAVNPLATANRLELATARVTTSPLLSRFAKQNQPADLGLHHLPVMWTFDTQPFERLATRKAPAATFQAPSKTGSG